MPLPAKKHLEPGGEIHRTVFCGHTDVAEVPGAVARGDVHAATEGDGEMRVVAADAGPIVKRFQRCACHTRVLVAEREVSMNIVADCLNAVPSRRRLLKEFPRYVRASIGFAIAAP